MISSDTRAVTVDVPASLADRVDTLAGRVERSPGWIVKQALAAYVEREERRYQLTLEGLADVDAGRAVDQSAVSAWAASLDADKVLPLPACD